MRLRIWRCERSRDRRGRLLRGYMYEFLKSFAPHLNRRLVDQAIRAGEGPALEALFDDVDLPLR